MLTPPISGDTWLGLSSEQLPVTVASQWVVLPSCGAVVVFSGTARDHSADRPGVDLLEYEAYETQVLPRFEAIAEQMRRRWDDLGRIALLHRVGAVAVGEAAVVVAASSPHRNAAFSAAKFGIDTLKSSVPIWKRERWQGGESWSLEPQHIRGVEEAAEAAAPGVLAASGRVDPPGVLASSGPIGPPGVLAASGRVDPCDVSS